VFRYTFDLDEWPSTHFNDSYQLRPFKGNIFLIHKYYNQVFPEDEFKLLEDLKETEMELLDGKIHKIRYSINLLTMLGSYIQTVPKEKGSGLEKRFMNEDASLL
jgi:hypothetical protein